MNAGLLIIILLLGLALLGFPIYIALGIGALAALNLADLPLIVLPQRMFAGMNGSALLAIPFFILAGNIMSRSITGKLINVSDALIGWIKGSLGIVTVLASALFGAISGSAVAQPTRSASNAEKRRVANCVDFMIQLPVDSIRGGRTRPAGDLFAQRCAHRKSRAAPG